MTTVEMENHQNIYSFFYRVLLFNPVLGSKTKPSRKHNHIPIIFFLITDFSYQNLLFSFPVKDFPFSLFKTLIRDGWIETDLFPPIRNMFLYLRSYKNYLSCKLQKPDEARLSMSLCPPSLPPYLPMTPPPFHGQFSSSKSPNQPKRKSLGEWSKNVPRNKGGTT